MNYPVFIFHEFVLRLSYLNREIGRYISNTIENGAFLIRTSNGIISIDKELLDIQYRDPQQISSEQLQQLAADFRIQKK